MVVVVREAGETGHAAVISFLLPLPLLPLLLLPAQVVVQLGLGVHLLGRLPDGHTNTTNQKPERHVWNDMGLGDIHQKYIIDLAIV